MNLVDRIDRAVFAVVDCLVLWIWNEFGVSWGSLVTALIAGSTVTSLARNCDWGMHYGAFFWTYAVVMLPLNTLWITALKIVPPDVRSSLNIEGRSSPSSRLLRATFIAFCGYDLLAMDGRAITNDAAWVLTFLIVEAAIPTGPREPRRRASFAFAGRAS